MIARPAIKLLLTVCIFLSFQKGFAQLQITSSTNAQALAQKLVGTGVIVSNAVVTQSTVAVPTAFFVNQGNTNLNIDSGIVLTTGRAKSDFNPPLKIGVDYNGTAAASTRLASTSLQLPGDQDLATAVGATITSLHDAVSLEFDVTPLGDTLTFRYVMSSEEYTAAYVCTYNDAFALLLSGPGITGQKNLALVPGTNTPVTITNVNNVPGGSCPNNIQYYVVNTTNVWFTHDGHTKVLIAKSEVQPCQTYHLKLVVADRGDYVWDSGVFLEAGSLNSDPVNIDNHTPLNEAGNPFVAEGCHTSEIHICRKARKPYPQTVNLAFAGNATNGIDLQTISSTYIIPANDSFVVVPIIPLADFVPEGNEHLKIYISNSGCGQGTYYSDSLDIELRDINMMLLDPGDSASICRNGSVQLYAEQSYLQYSWTGSGLSNNNIWNPLATPPTTPYKYICTATAGNCIAQDSILIKQKTVALLNKTDVFCHNGTNGQITVSGQNWDASVQYSINNQPYQSNPTFTNLPVGIYKIKMRDSTCVDSISVNIVQSFPDLLFTTTTTPATCSVVADGTINISASGGNGNYSYSFNGGPYQSQNVFSTFGGSWAVNVKDGNGCIEFHNVVVADTNTISLNAGADTILCEGNNLTIPATGNASSYVWSPSTGLNNPASLNPVAAPVVTTQYFITATDGRCTKKDSLQITVRPSPVANAGNDTLICNGDLIQLHGSGGISYQWSPTTYFTSASNIPDPFVKPISTITYSLTLVNSYQCRSLTPGKVTVTVTPPINLFAGRDTFIVMGQPFQLFVRDLSNAGVNQYTWTPSSFLNNANVPNPITTLSNDITYHVVGKTQAGCSGSDDINIKVYKGPEIFVPGAFTPNGDGKNDLLRVLAVGMKEFHYFTVYNRWGQAVFTTKDAARGWDGRISGIGQPNGVYIWTAEAVDYSGKKFFKKGTVIIIR